MRQIRTTPQMQENLATNSDNPLDNGEVPVLTSAAMNQSYSFDTGEHINSEGSSSPHQQNLESVGICRKILFIYFLLQGIKSILLN